MADFIPGLVSVITPVYKAERFIEKTMASVLQQSYDQLEFILVDDCGGDQSVNLIAAKKTQDPRIQLLHHTENKGAAHARNTALSAARGQYIAFVDADDVWHEAKLAKQIAFMRDKGYGFTYTNFALASEDGEIIKPRVLLPKELGYWQLLKNTAIACSTVVIDRQQVGDFRMPLVRKGQDTATWLMLMRERNVTAYLLDEVLNTYRQVENSISSNKYQALKRTWHTYRQLEQLSLPVAGYCFVSYALNALKRRL